jgi:hypothetical protein
MVVLFRIRIGPHADENTDLAIDLNLASDPGLSSRLKVKFFKFFFLFL